jgi:hypothetical protein
MSRTDAFSAGMGGLETTTLVDQEGSPQLREMAKRDSSGQKLAYVQYEHDPEVKQTNIIWMGSTFPGQGHVQDILHNLYNTHIDHTVNFGDAISGAGAHLMNKMGATYGRTKGTANINEDYAQAMAEEN